MEKKVVNLKIFDSFIIITYIFYEGKMKEKTNYFYNFFEGGRGVSKLFSSIWIVF